MAKYSSYTRIILIVQDQLQKIMFKIINFSLNMEDYKNQKISYKLGKRQDQQYFISTIFNSKLCGNFNQNRLIRILLAQILQMSTEVKQFSEEVPQNPETIHEYCYTIEGNIGCGKSTFLTLLKQRMPEAKWIEEPVSQWQNLGGKNINILEKYYKQPTRWGFTFQIYAIFTRIKALQEACERYPNKIKISQRSILADKYVFSQLMKDLGYMDEAQYDVFKSLYANFESMTNADKTRVVYLRCSPQKCHQRTKIRKRQQEDEIPLQYLKLIHQKHQNWFKQHDPKNVIVIDTTEDFKDRPEKINDMFNKLNDFIQQN